MPYATFEDYTKDFFGDIIPKESFSKFEYKARLELDRFTFGRLKGLQKIPEEAKQCVCEMTEYLYSEAQKSHSGISSESTDGYSVTYQKEKSGNVINKDLYQIAEKHLIMTGLLFRGIG